MKVKGKDIPNSWIIIIVLLILLVVSQMCNRYKVDVDCPEIDTAYITLPPIKGDTIYTPRPYPIYRDTGSTKIVEVEIPQDIDSLAIIRSYFSEWMIIDTIINDTNALIIITDWIAQNAIKERRVQSEFYPHMVKETTTIKLPYEPKVRLFGGVGVGRSINQFGLTANLMILDKKDRGYVGTYDVFNRDFYFTMYWKIKFKRNK